MSKLSEIGAVELYKHQKDAYRDYMVAPDARRELNKGGVLGGIGFLVEKTGAGFMQGLEGIWDFAAGGIAEIVGADEWAEKQVANDWFGDWYETAGQWYNPGEGWRVAGDVAGGIGTSLPSVLATVGVGLATGGAGAPVALTAFGTAATSAGGNAVKEAYRETGELGGKEWGYGSLVGTTEGVIEAATGGIGKGSGALIKGAAKSFGKTAAKEAAEAAVKQSAKKSVGKLIGKAAWQVGSNFASEAIEEGVAEWVAPYYARMTYDPSAQNATAEEIGYASFIGGLSGVLFKGADVAITSGRSAYYYGKAGKDVINGGRTDMILSTAKRVAEAEEASPSGYALLERIKNDYNSIKKLGDKVDTVSGRRKLGALQMRLAATGYLPQVEQSAINILNNPEAAAEAYRKMGAVDENGAPIEITAEKLTEGIDLGAIAKMDGKEQMVALRRAISDNKLLLTMAVADATGNMMVDTETYASNASQGALLGGRGAYQSFLENATPEQKRAVAERFGIEGDLDATSYNDFSTAAEKYRMSFEGASYISTTRSAIEAAKALPSNDRALPRAIGVTMKDGAYRYGDVTVIKDGDSVRFYDHQTGNLTREMTVKEANEALRSERKKALPDDTEASPEAKAKTETKIREIEAWAKENVKGYSELTPNERREIRAMIRQAKALGIPDIDIGRYANLSARTRVRVSFSKDRCFYDFAEDGSAIYADGFYDPKANEIVVNPEGKRSAARLILHELSHALYKGKYSRVLNSRIADMEKSAREATERRYKEEDASVIVEEVAVRHAEDVLGNEKNLDRLLRDEPTIGDKILSFFGVARYGDDAKLSRAAGKLLKHFERAMNKVGRENVTGLTVETARGTMDDARFSLQFSDNIAENQRAYRDSHTAFVSADVLNKAIDDTAEMVRKMIPHKDILPSDTVGKKGSTLVKNGSYDVSVENTTVCIRTLAYNAFTDMVSEKIGRPLSQMESFLVSQKLYDIAKEPQCLYCYVSLDRKAFNEMIIRYTEQRDAAIKEWEDAGKPSPSRSSDLYEKFRAGRKDTDNMWKRYSEWISAAKSGEKLITLSEVATESRRADIAQHGTASQKAQIADMLKYAQSASWAKKQTKYVAYYDDILRLSPKAVIDLNKHYGLRWYSFSDYSGAFIVENMQQVTDASLRGLKGLSYTKDVDFARIFAPTGMNINISVYATDINGKWEIDPKQSADIDAAIKLREQYPNVGIVVVAAKKEGVDWALAQEWSDVVIPFHIVRSGQDVANFYDWEVFNAEQGDTVVDENLWSQYVESLGNPKKVSKNIYPSEHQNSRETYLSLCEKRGIKPRFSSFLENPNYMKLVNETRQSERETQKLQPKFDLSAAEQSFDRFVQKGGYYEGWYNDGIDVEAEVETVAEDVLAGKKANEVSYGRQDRNGNVTPTPDELMASRKASRSHGRRMALPDDATYLDAVNRGDMATAQRMVDEAAKTAGYDSPKLYHGTGKFGFTEFDPTMSDDKISFFVSSNKNVSETYSGGGTVRPISSRADITPDGLDNASPVTILKLLRENVDKAYERISDQEHRNIVEKYRSDLDYAIHIASHIGDAVGASDKANALLATWVSHLEAMKEATTYNAFMDAYEALESSKWDLWRENSRLFDGVNGVTYQEIGSAYRGLTNVLDMTLYRKSGEEEYINQNEAITELNKYMFRGVYELYAKAGKQLKVDANGQNWNQIDGKNIGTEGPVRTRDVAKYAHDNGYDSVLIENVYDNGDYTFGGQGDVYIFFGSNHLKSADPVTYDDDGNIIPLSQRFNPKQSDIRFALPDDFESPTLDSVGKEKSKYKPTVGDKIFTAKTRTYIETVDELYGIETYLRKIGGLQKADVEARVQMARASRSQAQTMIGSAQYNVFSDNPEKMGDGLLEIYKPTRLWSAEKRKRFDDYLLHCLNIDRMTLESRSKAWTANERAAIRKVELDIATLNARQKTLHADIKKCDTAIVNARVKKGTAKTAATKLRWQAKLDALKQQKAALENDIKRNAEDIEKKQGELERLEKELKALELKNKPVFGKDETLDDNGMPKRDHDITAAESRAIVKEYEKKHPEFRELAKKLYAYLDNLQTMRVEAGLITREQADYMKKLYPHYVPSYRDTEGGGISIVKGKNNLEISRTVKKAKGGNQDILEVASSIATQTDELMKAGQINLLAKDIYEAAKASGDDTYVKILSEETVEDAEKATTDAILRPKPGQLTFYHEGKRITMEISKEIFIGFEGLRSPSVDFTNPLLSTAAAVNNIFKRGVTSLSPAFMLRNPIRDLQDAGLNSKHPALFVKELASSPKDIATNSKEWELYRALGGFSSTVFDGVLSGRAGYAGFESIAELFAKTDGATDLKAVWEKMSAPAKAVFRSIENANAFLEQMTRFAEFKASLAAGDSPAVALNNSAEVTTNFGRRGRTVKILNATVMPFLNPAVQGFDKIFRNVGEAFTGGHLVKGISMLIVKAALIGVAPMLLNSLMYDDDEDYERLRENDKENYFLIKTGDGSFIKVPRGRLASVIGGFYNRGSKLAKGEDADLGGYLNNVVTQVTPIENVSRDLFSPLSDVKNNRTWYGGEIEGREFDDTAPRDRYDESTSWIAVAIGSIIPNGWNFSPKKIHYLLDQYSGVIGDFVLPATSQKEHKDFFSGNFTLDSVTNNKLSEKFYALYDETQYADTAKDVNASFRLKYLNRVKKSIRTLNKELDAVRSDSIDNKEKLAKVRVIRALINAEYDAALKSVGAVDAAIGDTAAIEDETLRDAEITRRVFGAESALENYNEKTYEKYMVLHGGGIGYDELYAYHFATLGIESDLDKNGNVIEGSKKKKILSVINSLDIPKEQKLILLYSRGYSAKDGDIKGVSADRAKKMLVSYITKQQLTKAEKEQLAEACGFTVKNGKIVMK